MLNNHDSHGSVISNYLSTGNKNLELKNDKRAGKEKKEYYD